jgi:oxygen-independent coproporphyrinogen III oxidase
MDAMDADLLQFLDRRIPRYTSYPTAVQFGGEVDQAVYRNWLTALSPEYPVSIYVHVPFCAELCLYCGCHTTVARRYAPVAAYVDLLEREITLVGGQLGVRRKAIHVHWGGGTPTMLSAPDFQRIMRALRTIAAIGTDCETVIEIDPRTLKRDMVPMLADAGITRASLGVQDFNERVQGAVGRVQSFEQTARAATWLRQAGIANINLDLMYGLPYQSLDSVTDTVGKALLLDPDRIALFGYAHVPWMKKHQKLLPEHALPGTAERLAQNRMVANVLVGAGYQHIGLDHFAKPSDLLVARHRQKRLHRNFQGYTTDEAPVLIGFGTSAIGTFPQGYAQNTPSTVAYREAIAAGRFATARGCALTEEDRTRRDIIERLMCDLEVDLAEIAAGREKKLEDFSAELNNLDFFARRDLVRVRGGTITVLEHARPFVRNICAIFDAYLSREETRFSRAL